jgi:hypothetical protein
MSKKSSRPRRPSGLSSGPSRRIALALLTFLSGTLLVVFFLSGRLSHEQNILVFVIFGVVAGIFALINVIKGNSPD